MTKVELNKFGSLIAVATVILFNHTVLAQTFPERPVQIITPYAAGGGLDIITRTLAQRLSALWGKQVIVDNKPGAGSTLGTALAAKAPKDGYTLLVASTPLGVAPAVYSGLSYDARRDFAPLSLRGASGIGAATARKFIAGGWSVAINYLDESQRVQRAEECTYRFADTNVPFRHMQVSC